MVHVIKLFETSRWTDLQDYLRLDRTPLYCGNDDTGTKGFGRSHKNLHFFWILGAGHFVSKPIWVFNIPPKNGLKG